MPKNPESTSRKRSPRKPDVVTEVSAETTVETQMPGRRSWIPSSVPR